MKQRPILYSPPMVSAILKGTKKKTRRTKGLDEINKKPSEWKFIEFNNGIQISDGISALFYNIITREKIRIRIPYGQVGDILWVRETWKFLGQSVLEEYVVMFKDGTINEVDYDDQDVWLERLENLSDIMEKKGKVIVDEENERFEWKNEDVPWKPSIHMPKEIARIFLQITDIRVERLMDISVKDAIAEGIEETKKVNSDPYIRYKNYNNPSLHHSLPEDFASPLLSFKSLWNSINGDKSFNKNPWVWVIEFKQVEKPNDKND